MMSEKQWQISGTREQANDDYHEDRDSLSGMSTIVCIGLIKLTDARRLYSTPHQLLHAILFIAP